MPSTVLRRGPQNVPRGVAGGASLPWTEEGTSGAVRCGVQVVWGALQGLYWMYPLAGTWRHGLGRIKPPAPPLPLHAHPRGGYNSDGITKVGVGWGGLLSQDAVMTIMTITIAPFSLYRHVNARHVVTRAV